MRGIRTREGKGKKSKVGTDNKYYSKNHGVDATEHSYQYAIKRNTRRINAKLNKFIFQQHQKEVILYGAPQFFYAAASMFS